MPSLRKSRHFFSLPCQCIRSKTLPQRIVTVHHFSFANHISAFLCHSIAELVNASHLLLGAVPCLAQPLHALLRFAFALPVCASQCRCNAVGRSTLPLHSSSPHSLCHTSSCTAFAEHRDAQPSHGQSNSALPLPSIAALRLRESGPSMPCRCSQAFTS